MIVVNLFMVNNGFRVKPGMTVPLDFQYGFNETVYTY